MGYSLRLILQSFKLIIIKIFVGLLCFSWPCGIIINVCSRRHIRERIRMTILTKTKLHIIGNKIVNTHDFAFPRHVGNSTDGSRTVYIELKGRRTRQRHRGFCRIVFNKRNTIDLYHHAGNVSLFLPHNGFQFALTEFVTMLVEVEIGHGVYPSALHCCFLSRYD